MLRWISHQVPSCSWHKGNTGDIPRVLGNLTEIWLCPQSYPDQMCMSGWYRISLVLMTAYPWLMSHHAMALSLCLNKPHGLKYFAKLEPDHRPSWALSGHTNRGIRPYLPINARQSQSSVCKNSADLKRKVCVIFQFSPKGTVWTLPQPQRMWIFVIAKKCTLRKARSLWQKDSFFGTDKTGYIINMW